MGNHSSGFSKTFVTNQSHNNKESKRPHSVLGITDDNNRCNFKSAILRSNNNNSNDNNINNNKINNKYMRPPGMQLPPLPRSHSFHQALRPTENGQILAAKGTIRGLEFNKPLLTNNTSNTKSPIADELKAILNSRRCKSETDLAADNNSSNDSNQSEGSNYDDSNKRKEFNAIRKSSASNGVAAKIQRAKYRAPPPPQHITGSTPDLSNGTHTNYDNSNLTDSHKKSAKHQFIGSSSSSTGSSGANTGNIGNSAHNNLDINKKGLTRNLSQKSYTSSNNINNNINNNDCNKIPSDESSRFLIIPRLKLTPQQAGHKDPGNDNGGQTKSTSANHVMQSRYQSRNLIFDSKYNNFEANQTKTDCNQDYRKLRRSSSSNYESDMKSKTKSDLIPIEKQNKTKSIEKLSRELSNRDNTHNNHSRDFIKISDNPFYRELNSINSHDLFPELHNNSNNNKNNNNCNKYKYFDEMDFNKSNDYYSDRKVRNNNKSAGSPALPPAFDDNFILRRNTPTAGLNEQKSSYYFNKPNVQQNEKQSKNKTNAIPTKRATLPWSDTDSYNTNGTRVHHLTNDDIMRPSKPFNVRQHTASSPPPPPPLLNFEYEFDITRANCKSIRTNVSDSANYSDEDEEEEIKVIIRPQLPPLKREQLSELRRERILLSEDLFNLKPFTSHKSNHCWTPLHDLSTSDDDDGINSGNHSDESIQKSEKELNSNCYDTRFTLKNQLRTLVHNNKIKQNQSQLFPY